MTDKTNLLGLTDDQKKILTIFNPENFKRISHAIENNYRFVHYTSAETGLKIIQSKQVWMRKANTMNDFSEIQHGLDCLRSAFIKNKELFVSTLDAIFPNITKRLEENFDKRIPEFVSHTYMASVSEHNTITGVSEDEIGRLSMWRAYGGSAGVAMVMNGMPFHTPTDALKAYTYPVSYSNPQKFDAQYLQLIDRIKANAEWLTTLGEDLVYEQLFEFFRNVVLCTKHPGFYEEREWRIIYSPSFEETDTLIFDIQTIEGTPQPIWKIPLKNLPERGLNGIEVPQLIDRVIIGPAAFPKEIREAFVMALLVAGVTDASSRVWISFIPLRR